ncbi:hypothetical protein [Mycobacterium triplex]|uniref:Uncharacterized protein n=1 Tax=Mycobacterium triplex TaxID=47839 RepID=A0A024JZ71_9MYCO|nr:hypothetical protein [Mycobacterium triplex]CDO88553.1 hypothetical protein BN973_02922 [Mycobacterium triplex]
MAVAIGDVIEAVERLEGTPALSVDQEIQLNILKALVVIARRLNMK